ncbi:hypothetical protein BJV74DRAFT_826338 [Russula compacta]|nr:hypothetical protein BJV74DRAFT_826338 [Russula compacta]
MDSIAIASGGSRPRYDSNQLLTLPAPLALSRPTATGGSSVSVARSSEDVYSDNSSSHQRLVSSPASNTTEQPAEDHFGSPISTPTRRSSPGRGNNDHQVVRPTAGHGAIRQVISPTPFPVETTNPFQSSYDNYSSVEHDIGSASFASDGQSRVRGVSLSDNGPVPGPDGVRRVSRPSSRRMSQPPSQNRYSRSASLYANLPPGAAPPNPNGGSD